MIELETQINDVMNKLNQNWITAIKEAAKSGEGIDLSDVFGKYSELVQLKDKAFLEAEQRLGRKGIKKKGIFGWKQMDEYEEIKTKMKNFFEKKLLSNETVYFILKDLQEEMWDNIKAADDDDDLDDDELDDFDDEPVEEPTEELEKPEPVLNKEKAVKTFIKKPKIKVKEGSDPDGLDW